MHRFIFNIFFRLCDAVTSTHSISGASASSKFVPTSKRGFKGLKDYGRKLVNLELFTQSLGLGF